MTLETPYGLVSETDAFASVAEYERARDEVRAAAAAYYNDDVSLIDDATYDALTRRVAASEMLHPEWVSGAVLGALVGAGVETGGDVAHAAQMLSLDNVFSAEELDAFMDRVEKLVGHSVATWRVEPKFDGLALSARYVGGRLSSLVTRGDGTSGEDVLGRVKAIAGLPETLKAAVDVEVRGECVMSDDDFVRANDIRLREGEPLLKNQRQGAAGTVRSKNRSYELPLTFFAYTLLEDGVEVRDQSAAMGYLKDLGVQVSNDARTCVSREDVKKEVARYLDERATLGVPIDGAVIKVDDLATRRAAGTSSRAPRWAIAYKYPADTRATDLLGIDVSVGRTGNLSFTAVLSPVDVGGVTVSAATVHNPTMIAQKGLRLRDEGAANGRYQQVWVRRAGDVIPEITAPVSDETDGTIAYEAVRACPRCGGALDTSGAIWRCLRGRACALQEVLEYAVARDCLDIEGLGPSILSALVENGALARVTDIFALTLDDLLKVERLGEKNSVKILDHIERARALPMNRVFCALGVGMTGRSMSRRLAASFGTMDALRRATSEELQRVEAVGPERAKRIMEDMALLSDDLDYLEAHGIGQSEPVAESASGDGPLSGQTWVVTGTMKGALVGKSRQDVKNLLEGLGAKTSDSVSSSTTVLLVGENAGSKVAKAQERGVTVVDEATFAATYLA